MDNRLTMTSDRGGLAFTFALDITCKPSEMRKIIALGERLKAYEDTGKTPEDIAIIQSVMEQDHIRLKELESENASLRTQPENKPLTLEELREMCDSNEPVWMNQKKQWVFIASTSESPYAQVWYFRKGFVYTVLYHHDKFYRHKPKEEHHEAD